LESIVTGPYDEWPIHPSDEWPIRPDPRPGAAAQPNLPRINVAPDETESAGNEASQPDKWRNMKHNIKVSSIFVGVVTLVFGFVYITDIFDGDEVWVFGAYAFVVLMGLLDIFTEEDSGHSDPAYGKKLKEAVPRRTLISDDQPPIIAIPRTTDATGPTDDSKPTGTSDHDDAWPVLPQEEEPKPKFDVYQPDAQSETHDEYWPHLPLPEKPTMYDRLRRISWVTGCFMLFTTLLSVVIGFTGPDESAYPAVQIFFGILSGFCFVIAYSKELFLGGDH
jgi:hypothetical protein